MSKSTYMCIMLYSDERFPPTKRDQTTSGRFPLNIHRDVTASRTLSNIHCNNEKNSILQLYQLLWFTA